MKEVDQDIRDYYAEQSLSDASVERILQAGRLTRRPWWRQAGWLTTAALGILVITFLVIPRSQAHLLAARVGQEVLANHEKQLDPEVKGDSYEQIQSALPRLGFSLVPTEPGLLADWTPAGGRYCSLNDALAAQIVLTNRQGAYSTLYVAPLTDSLLKIDPCVQHLGEVEIQIWKDAHRLYVQAYNR